MKKSLMYFGILIFCCSITTAQIGGMLVGNEVNGDKRFKENAYADALGFYEKAYENDSSKSLQLKIGDCYYYMNRPLEAEKWYANSITLDSLSPDMYYRYAQTLKANQKYEEALVWFAKYDRASSKEINIARQIEGIDELISDTSYVSLKPVDFNSNQSDFSPAYFEDKIVFASNRKDKVKSKSYHWDNTNYLDVLITKKIGDTTYADPISFDQNINTKHHDGPISFFDNNAKAVFTRNNYDQGKIKRDKNAVSHLQLFFAEREGEQWINIQPFSHNNEDFSSAHATINDSGTLMVFVSDNPEGFGKSDLYKSENFGAGWTYPENLGETINTYGNEMFPFLKGDSLFFASDGHGGLGGLDLFYIDLSAQKRKVENLGTPYNSSRDDFGLIINGKEGYLSSNRNGNDDIFYFKDKTPMFNDMVTVSISLVDINTGEILENPLIKLKSLQNDKELIPLKSDDKHLIFEIDPFVPYEVYGAKKGFFLNSEKRSTKIEKGRVNWHIPLEKIQTNKQVVLNNIYYDLNKASLREESFIELDRLYEWMNENPTVSIELNAHTDSRGSDDYNLELSQRRAESAENYLLDKGVSPDRLQAKGYGETKLLNGCENGVDCSEGKHQVNRRTEFRVTDYSPNLALDKK